MPTYWRSSKTFWGKHHFIWLRRTYSSVTTNCCFLMPQILRIYPPVTIFQLKLEWMARRNDKLLGREQKIEKHRKNCMELKRDNDDNFFLSKNFFQKFMNLFDYLCYELVNLKTVTLVFLHKLKYSITLDVSSGNGNSSESLFLGEMPGGCGDSQYVLRFPIRFVTENIPQIKKNI